MILLIFFFDIDVVLLILNVFDLFKRILEDL